MDTQFRSWTPKTRNAARIPSEKWGMYKDELQEMRADSVTLAKMVAKLREKYGFSVKVEQLKKQLTSWDMISSSGELHHSTNQQQAHPTSSTPNLTSTNTNSSTQRAECAASVAQQNQTPGSCYGTRKRKDTFNYQSRQQNAKVPFRSSSLGTANASVDLLNNPGQMQAAGMELPNTFLKASPAHEDSSKSVDVEQFSLERQHLKNILQYIHDFKHDLHELVPELLETPVSNNESPTWHTPENHTPIDLEHDVKIRRSNGECCSKLYDEHCDQSGGTIRALRNHLPTLTELGQSRNPDEHVTQPQWRCASPAVFLPTRSLRSVSTSFRSTQQRVQRCWPLHTDRDEETENLAPSDLVRQRQSMSSASFGSVTGMAPCPSEIRSGWSDDVDGMDLTGDDVMEGLGNWCLGA